MKENYPNCCRKVFINCDGIPSCIAPMGKTSLAKGVYSEKDIANSASITGPEKNVQMAYNKVTYYSTH